MPLKHPKVDEGGQRLQDAVVARVDREVGALGVVFLGLRVRRVKERGWRKLPLITGDDKLLAPQDRRHRFRRADLAGLIEDHDVEVGSVRGQQLGDDKRAHRPAWLDREHHVRRRREQLPHRQVLALLAGLGADQARLVRQRIFGGDCMFCAEAADALRGGLDVLAIGVLEFTHDLSVVLAVERAEAAVAELKVLDDGGEPHVAKHRAGFLPTERLSVHAVKQLGQPESFEFRSEPMKFRQLAEGLDIGQQGIERAQDRVGRALDRCRGRSVARGPGAPPGSVRSWPAAHPAPSGASARSRRGRRRAPLLPRGSGLLTAASCSSCAEGRFPARSVSRSALLAARYSALVSVADIRDITEPPSGAAVSTISLRGRS